MFILFLWSGAISSFLSLFEGIILCKTKFAQQLSRKGLNLFLLSFQNFVFFFIVSVVDFVK